MSDVKPKREMAQLKKLVYLFENNLEEIKQVSIHKLVTIRFPIENKPCVN